VFFLGNIIWQTSSGEQTHIDLKEPSTVRNDSQSLLIVSIEFSSRSRWLVKGTCISHYLLNQYNQILRCLQYQTTSRTTPPDFLNISPCCLRNNLDLIEVTAGQCSLREPRAALPRLRRLRQRPRLQLLVNNRIKVPFDLLNRKPKWNSLLVFPLAFVA